MEAAWQLKLVGNGKVFKYFSYLKHSPEVLISFSNWCIHIYDTRIGSTLFWFCYQLYLRLYLSHKSLIILNPSCIQFSSTSFTEEKWRSDTIQKSYLKEAHIGDVCLQSSTLCICILSTKSQRISPGLKLHLLRIHLFVNPRSNKMTASISGTEKLAKKCINRQDKILQQKCDNDENVIILWRNSIFAIQNMIERLRETW